MGECVFLGTVSLPRKLIREGVGVWESVRIRAVFRHKWYSTCLGARGLQGAPEECRSHLYIYLHCIFLNNLWQAVGSLAASQLQVPWLNPEFGFLSVWSFAYSHGGLRPSPVVFVPPPKILLVGGLCLAIFLNAAYPLGVVGKADFK